MRSTLVAMVLCLVCSAVPAQEGAAEGDWEPIEGEEVLREFMSGLRAELVRPGGGKSVAEYRGDGTGLLRAWGETYSRTWTIEGGKEVCITQEGRGGVWCATLERSTEDPTLYRVRESATGELTEFRADADRALATGTRKDTSSAGGAAAASAAEIAAKLANPNAAMGTLSTNFDYILFDGDLPGAGDESGFTLGFQPSLPYPLGGGKNFFVRPLFPIIVDQPLPNPEGGFDSAGVELGDIGFDAAVGFSLAGGNVVVVGATGAFPTATDDAVGKDQWLLGPEFLFAAVRKWGVVALLATHMWDIAGEDSFDTSLSSGQYIYSFFLKNGWSISAQPPWSYNHEADSDDAFSFALGIGVGKTAIFAGRPWKLSAQYWNFIEGPEAFGPNHQVRITIGPVVNLPWGE